MGFFFAKILHFAAMLVEVVISPLNNKSVNQNAINRKGRKACLPAGRFYAKHAKRNLLK
jgi:hypothetical protein